MPLAALVVLGAFLVMVVTGLSLWLRPAGFEASGLRHAVWRSIHINTGLVFLAGVAFHTVYNWKTLARYLRPAKPRGLRWPRELSLALLLVGVIVVGAALDLPPVSNDRRCPVQGGANHRGANHAGRAKSITQESHVSYPHSHPRPKSAESAPWG